jgi:hypothetical protein
MTELTAKCILCDIENRLNAISINGDGPGPDPEPDPGVFLFNYENEEELENAGFSFVAQPGNRNTVFLEGIAFNENGFMRVNHQPGTIFEGNNSSVNQIVLPLNPGWTSVTLRMEFSFTPAPTSIGDSFLYLYNDDDNYMGIGVAHNNDLGSLRVWVVSEFGGSYNTITGTPWANTTDLWLRIVKTPNWYEFLYSSDNSSYTMLDVQTFPMNDTICLSTAKVGSAGNYNTIYKSLTVSYT